MAAAHIAPIGGTSTTPVPCANPGARRPSTALQLRQQVRLYLSTEELYVCIPANPLGYRFHHGSYFSVKSPGYTYERVKANIF